MKAQKKCREKGCPGHINLDQPVPIRVGCNNFSIAYPCDNCGRLHWSYKLHAGIRNQRGEKGFWISGQLVNRK